MRFLGTITVPATTSRTNLTTVSPFELPSNPCSVVFVPSATGLLLEFKAAPSATDGFPLLADSRAFPWAGREAGVIGLYNTAGAPIACKLYATDGPGIPTTLA